MPADNPFKLHRGQLDFVLLFAKSGVLEESAGVIFDLAARYDADVSLHGSLAVITFGVFGIDPLATDKRLRLVRELAERFRLEIKLVHGSGPGHYGLVGGRKAARFDVFLPQFNRTKTVLENLEWGETRELAD